MDELAHAVGQDALEFRRKLMANHPKQPRRAQRGGREDRLGQARAAGRPSRPRRSMMALRQLRGGVRRGLGRTATRSRSTASSRRPTRATPSIRRRSSGRLPARSSTGCRRCSTGVHGQGRPHRADQLRHLQLDAHRARCRRSNRSSCRPAARSGAASASRRSAWRRPRCSTRIFAATGKRIRSFPLKEPQPARSRDRNWGGGLIRPPLLFFSVSTAGQVDMTAAAPIGVSSSNHSRRAR